MFISLPRRCIILLEDIDSAGLVKRQEEGGKVKDNKGISLSGLLNAIDGVASPEGRVLVMTTNCLEKLDEALIRAGRIDIKIQFNMATRSQISQLFACMYTPDNPSSSTITFDKELPNPKHVNDLASGKFASLQSGVNKLTPTNLDKMGKDFANKLPDSKFTLAELQGYFLTRKKDPWRALEEVDELEEGAECRVVPCEIDSSTKVHGVEPLLCLDS
jgi:chaperone BCS1